MFWQHPTYFSFPNCYGLKCVCSSPPPGKPLPPWPIRMLKALIYNMMVSGDRAFREVTEWGPNPTGPVSLHKRKRHQRFLSLYMHRSKAT